MDPDYIQRERTVTPPTKVGTKANTSMDLLAVDRRACLMEVLAALKGKRCMDSDRDGMDYGYVVEWDAVVTTLCDLADNGEGGA